MATEKLTVLEMPKVHATTKARRKHTNAHPLWEDKWFIAVIIISIIAGAAAWWYYFSHGEVLLYNDAGSHLILARRVIDSPTPGLAQLGGVWLPLPHLIMIPLIWNDYLWRTGLAGSFTSMPLYIITAIYLYQSAKRLTHNGMASFIGTLVFILNPNILYLQATPLSELTLFATMTITCYYFLAWTQTDDMADLVKSAAAAFFMCIARYDGWSIFIACLTFIVVIGLLRKHAPQKIVANTIIFGWLGGLSIILWFVWNKIIFGSFLYFQNGPYSAQSQQAIAIQNHTDRTYHSVWYAFHDYTAITIESIGPIVFAIAILGLLVYLIKGRFRPEVWGAGLFLVPFAFYVLSLYTGQALIYAPHAAPSIVNDVWFNDRYGSGTAITAAIYAASFINLFKIYLKPVFIGLIIIQSVLTFRGGVLTVQDGQFGVSCYSPSIIPFFLAAHYDTGYILNDNYSTGINFSDATPYVSLSDVVYQGSGKLWYESLAAPAKYVDWIIVSPGDLVSRYININGISFNAEYQLLITDPQSGVRLYRLRGLPALPTRNIQIPNIQAFSKCGTLPLLKPTGNA